MSTKASLRISCILLSCWIFPSSIFHIPLQSLKENIMYLLSSYAFIYIFEWKRWGAAIFASGIGTLGILCSMILFGCTFDKLESAAVASLYISLLVFFPAGLEFGFNGDSWKYFFSVPSKSISDKSIKRYQYLFYGTLMVGILAPVVHPLDWQRNWQKWPIPVVVGAQIGSIIAIIITDIIKLT